MGPPTIFYFEIYNRICKIYLYKEVMVISKFRMKVLCTYIPATNPNPNPNPNPTIWSVKFNYAEELWLFPKPQYQ